MNRLITITLFILLMIGVYFVFVPSIQGPTGKSQENSEAKSIARSVNIALNLLGNDVGFAVGNEINIEVLYSNVDNLEKWNGPYLKTKIAENDPWGNKWMFKSGLDCRVNAKPFIFYSIGENGVDECMEGDDVF